MSRLDYLCELGVDGVWLSPFYRSPMADFGYDVCDHTDVDPLFGTLADADLLVAEAHRRGLRVLVDWVPDHTSDRHPWFVASRSRRDDPMRDWYVWRDPAPGGGPPNNWRSAFPRVGSAWTPDRRTGQYYLHSHMREQPDLDWANPRVRAAMAGVLRFWLDRGVDGVRVDAAQRLGKDPLLRDNVPGGPRHDVDWPTGLEHLRGVRRVLDEYDDRVAVGEVWLLDQRALVRYVNGGDGLHLAHDLVLPHQPWDARALRRTVDELELLLAGAAWPAWFLNSHDLPRTASRYSADGRRDERRARVAALLTLTLRGTAFLYQGEELGLPDVPVPPDRQVDVDGRDPQRCPLPWQPPSVAGPGAGFTTGRPWLPITADAERLNVASQSTDPGSTLAFYRRLLALRRATPALHSGSYRSLPVDPPLLAYRRASPSGDRLVVLNVSAEPVRLDGRSAGLAGRATVELSTSPEAATDGRVDLAALEVGPDEGLVLAPDGEGA